MFDIPAALEASATLATTILQWKMSGHDAEAAALEKELGAIREKINMAHDKADAAALESGIGELTSLQLRVASGAHL